jgi:hypothetical protein
MEKPIEIGRCKGCDRRARLDDGVCSDCLQGRGRGRKWAEISHRVRTDKEFALTCYNAVKANSGNKPAREVVQSCSLFELMYGLPPGAVRPGDRPRLYAVTEEEAVCMVMEA